ncbi:MAG: DNA-binding protein Alba [Candidatus Bathyarchaeota archaeon]|nr:MAG: DNA-binding protein Alba [Candidatus Bathyarchaeota archaeon]
MSEEPTKDQNVIYIGRKPVMSYVLAVITSLNMPDVDALVLKARGRAITTAVDVAEITRRRFVDTIKVDRIEIGTEEVEGMDGRARNVSTIEIDLKR